MTKQGLSRAVHFEKGEDSTEMSIEVFSHIVRELTGDWIAPIECMKIQEEERFFHDEVVFFGKLEELGPTGKVHALQEASMLDKYKFD
mgnify:FL=1